MRHTPDLFPSPSDPSMVAASADFSDWWQRSEWRVRPPDLSAHCVTPAPERGEEALVSILNSILEIRGKDRHVIGNHHVIQIIQRDIVIEENIDKENILTLTSVDSQRLVRFQKRNPGFKVIVVVKVRSLCYSRVLIRGEDTVSS